MYVYIFACYTYTYTCMHACMRMHMHTCMHTKIHTRHSTLVYGRPPESRSRALPDVSAAELLASLPGDGEAVVSPGLLRGGSLGPGCLLTGGIGVTLDLS